MLPYEVPYLQLRRLISQRCKVERARAGSPNGHASFTVRYIQSGQERIFSMREGVVGEESDTTLATDLSWFASKLLIFRSFGADNNRDVCFS